MAYYNTNNETGDTRDKSWRTTYKQEKMLLFVFFRHCYPRGEGKESGVLAPHQVQDKIYELYGRKIPLTSVRRGISDLTKEEMLIKTEKMVAGNYGKMVHTWQLNPLTLYRLSINDLAVPRSEPLPFHV